MNDSTLPPSKRVVPKGKPTRPAATTTAAGRVTVPRGQKVAARKGFGLSDWNRLKRVSKDLAQLKGQPIRNIHPKEIKTHDSIHDAWISLNGKVYNITPYLHYHPGGVDIFKGTLGTDVSDLYKKYHPWVNADGLIGNLCIGYLDTSKDDDEEDSAPAAYLPKQVLGNDGFAMPAPRPPKIKAGNVPSVLSNKNQDRDEDEEDLNPWEKS
mmetsp:Transcript_28020/g.39389  ORF Transcript_28020/g.39389 Transcript_28020/m.39389 type:complete len:210 (-) Transcript_28020:89-718(-)